MVHVDGSGWGRVAAEGRRVPDAATAAAPASSRLEEIRRKYFELRALEANCAASIFAAGPNANQMARHKPEANSRELAFHWQRSSPYHLAGNRNAAHPVNATLNYAYAALESEIRIKAISEGYDPTIGIMHEGSDDRRNFIFDLMEPERPKVDRAVLDSSGAMFSIQPICHSSRWRLQA